MAKGQGFPRGGNMNDMLKQAQRLQKEIEKAKTELDESEFETTSAGGKITVKVNGKKELLSIKLDPAIVDPDDIEMLEDIIQVAVNEALTKVDGETEKRLGQYSLPF